MAQAAKADTTTPKVVTNGGQQSSTQKPAVEKGGEDTKTESRNIKNEIAAISATIEKKLPTEANEYDSLASNDDDKHGETPLKAQKGISELSGQEREKEEQLKEQQRQKKNPPKNSAPKQTRDIKGNNKKPNNKGMDCEISSAVSEEIYWKLHKFSQTIVGTTTVNEFREGLDKIVAESKLPPWYMDSWKIRPTIHYKNFYNLRLIQQLINGRIVPDQSGTSVPDQKGPVPPNQTGAVPNPTAVVGRQNEGFVDPVDLHKFIISSTMVSNMEISQLVINLVGDAAHLYKTIVNLAFPREGDLFGKEISPEYRFRNIRNCAAHHQWELDPNNFKLILFNKNDHGDMTWMWNGDYSCVIRLFELIIILSVAQFVKEIR